MYVFSFRCLCFFFFKQKTAYEMRISDWSSDVCSSDLELGFLRPLREQDSELLRRIVPSIGSAIEAARYRQRLQKVLAETQQLNEELQVQQEELRAANEELEEQSNALRESQAHMEEQQAELEQTNEQLAEQTERSEERRVGKEGVSTGKDR